MRKLTPEQQKLCDFACEVCLEKYRADGHPDAQSCAWQSMDNEYCPELLAVLDRKEGV